MFFFRLAARPPIRVLNTVRAIGVATTASLMLTLASGCASETHDVDGANAAISSDEAARAFPSTKKVLSNLKSGPGAAALVRRPRSSAKNLALVIASCDGVACDRQPRSV